MTELPTAGPGGPETARDVVPIEVLLAARDGASYLPAQLDSILSQTVRDLRVLVRDDGSVDETSAVVDEYARRHPGRVVPVASGVRALGVVSNFGALLERSTAPYVMLSDQDDVWLEDKVARTRARMAEMEAGSLPSTPLLVHTDLTVVDRDLRATDPSFWRSSGLDPELGLRLSRLLVQNVVTGSTTMVNRALLSRALPVPAEAMMHDWWLALVAAAFGRIGYVPAPTVLYRQHGANTLGARRFGLLTMARRLRALARDPAPSLATLRATIAQGRAFRDRYRDDLRPADREALDAFCSLPDLPAWRRRRVAVRSSLLKIGLARNAVWLGYWLPRL